MLKALIRWSLDNRLVVLVAAAISLILGLYLALQLPIDVFPDLTAPRVTVITEAHNMAPEEVEVSRPSDALEARAAANDALTALLVGLGAVALLVGGAGLFIIATAAPTADTWRLRFALIAIAGAVALATFIATFVYSVLVLRVVRDAYETAGDPGFVPQLSLLIATGLMAASIVVLVYFLNHVPASIRINAVLEGIGERLLRSVRDRFPKECAAEQQDQPPQGAPVAATGTGYIQIIDFAGLDRIARDVECRIELRLRPGDFVHPDVVLLAVVGAKPDDAMADGLRDCFSLGAMRSPSQDIEFLIDELVEIALRALSPGINDPFTAVTALHWLGAATAQIGARDLRGGPDRGDYDWNRIVPMNDDFDHFVRRGFGGIRAAAATSPIAAAQFLDCLLGAGSTLTLNGRRARLREEGALLMAQARLELAGPSLDEVEARYCDFLAAMKDGTHERLSS